MNGKSIPFLEMLLSRVLRSPAYIDRRKHIDVVEALKARRRTRTRSISKNSIDLLFMV